MKRIILFIILTCWMIRFLDVYAQVGINTSSPTYPFQVNIDSAYTTPVTDQFTSGWNSVLTLSHSQSAGQSFIAGMSGPLLRVHVILSGGTGLVELKLSQGSTPDGQVIGTRSFAIPWTQLTEYAFEFTPAPNVNAGDPLFITLTNLSGGPMEWRKNSDNPYPAGQAWINTGSWNMLAADDMIFLTYMIQPDTLSIPALMVKENGTVAFKSYTFPLSDGLFQQVMVTDGQGHLGWAHAASLTERDRIHDTDSDTQIQTEENEDENIIRFDIAGTERMTLLTNQHHIPRLELHHESGNTLVGTEAGASLNAINGLGSRNTFMGHHSGQQTTTGYHNVALGYGSMLQNTGGFVNTAIGYETMHANTSGAYNTAIGAKAMRSNTLGGSNTAMGHNALLNNTTGEYHTAIGRSALSANTTGSSNTAVGKYVLSSNTTGSFNTALGADAMRFNTTGQYNTAMGLNALVNNTIGHSHTAIGAEALRSNTTGHYNTAIGRDALRQNTTGHSNTAQGFEALRSNTTGHGNTATGFRTLASNTDGLYNTAFGAYALESSVWTYENSAFGFAALSHATSGSANTAFGYNALKENTAGSWNTAAGRGVMASNTTGNGNTAMGRNAQFYNTTGSQNTAVGMEALQNNTTGYSNTAVGVGALLNNTTGYSRTGVGYNANSSAGEYNFSTGIGFNSAPTAAYQIRIGHQNITSIGGYVGWSNLSDGRFKKNIDENVPGLSFIAQLRPVTYQMDIPAISDFLAEHHQVRDSLDTDHGSGKEAFRYTGFIAQEVEAVARAHGFDFSGVDAPKNEDDLYSLRYAEFVVPLVKAVQEQQILITSMQQELTQLRTVLNQYQRDILQNQPDTTNGKK